MTTRHALMAQTLRQHGRDLLTDVELAEKLALIIATYSCDCIECTD